MRRAGSQARGDRLVDGMSPAGRDRPVDGTSRAGRGLGPTVRRPPAPSAQGDATVPVRPACLEWEGAGAVRAAIEAFRGGGTDSAAEDMPPPYGT